MLPPVVMTGNSRLVAQWSVRHSYKVLETVRFRPSLFVWLTCSLARKLSTAVGMDNHSSMTAAGFMGKRDG